MKLVSERDGDVVVLGEGFTFESAADFIGEGEEGFDYVLIDGGVRYLYEIDYWIGWSFENGEWVQKTVCV
jgi:hypothetical protein